MLPKPKNSLLTIINTALSAAILLYVVNTEHRLTALETRVAIALEKNQPESLKKHDNPAIR